MAYRRTSRTRSGSGYSKRGGTTARRSRPAGRRSGGGRGPGEVRVVIEMANASPISRPDLPPLRRDPNVGKKAKF